MKSTAYSLFSRYLWWHVSYGFTSDRGFARSNLIRYAEVLMVGDASSPRNLVLSCVWIEVVHILREKRLFSLAIVKNDSVLWLW